GRLARVLVSGGVRRVEPAEAAGDWGPLVLWVVPLVVQVELGPSRGGAVLFGCHGSLEAIPFGSGDKPRQGDRPPVRAAARSIHGGPRHEDQGAPKWRRARGSRSSEEGAQADRGGLGRQPARPERAHEREGAPD